MAAPASPIKIAACGLWIAALGLAAAASRAATPRNVHAEFQTSDRCVACHNGMSSAASAQDYSIGIDWSTSLMANSSRDPYWQASVRRETIDHAAAKKEIEDECSSCHMPVTKYMSKQGGELAQVFAHLPLNAHAANKAAADGVTCSVCHQITPQNLGSAESFNGNFNVGGPDTAGSRPEFGPYDVTAGRQRIMRTSTEGFQPQQGDQIRSAELCASCHTLTTEARDASGAVVGSLPEQMPYQEWLRSDFRNRQTCQSCHMPAVGEAVAITRILGEPRPGAARHQFVGANFVMQNILGRNHDELGASAEPQELFNAAGRTMRYLRTSAAQLLLAPPQLRNRRIEQDVTVTNLGGHKLPTAYPSRRTWLHVVVHDRDQRTVFESGALNPDGSIAGNDNDADPNSFEPHYREIRTSDQVQIYESIIGDANGKVTTGLLTAARYLKDNRLLPRGFAKDGAPPEIAVHGDALADPAFTDRGHTLRYSVDIGGAVGPFTVDVELWYQPIGYRWANNLKNYDAEEPRRFVGYFDSIGAGSAVLLAKASSSIP